MNEKSEGKKTDAAEIFHCNQRSVCLGECASHVLKFSSYTGTGTGTGADAAQAGGEERRFVLLLRKGQCYSRSALQDVQLFHSKLLWSLRLWALQISM